MTGLIGLGLIYLPPAREPLSLALWWFLGREYPLLVLEKGTDLIMQSLVADHVIGLTAQDSTWLVKTSLYPLNNPLSLLAIAIYSTRITISFPLFWGLALASLSAYGNWPATRSTGSAHFRSITYLGLLNRAFIRSVIFEGIFIRMAGAPIPPLSRDRVD